ncbi:MAG: hypothetical protein CUN55_12355 [Phototrophicales bacterium]|nr:MAG: hypothetical protein CUN55_12355 [Phototrophicales bacterium]
MQEKPSYKNNRPIQDFLTRLGILGELLSYLWAARLYWMLPMVVMLILFAVLIILGSTGAGGPLIYTLF